MMATLYDPAVGEATPLIIELRRLISTVDANALVLRRVNIDKDEIARPFGLGWLVKEVMIEGRRFRDITLAAAMMSLLALAPAIFWQLIIDRVLAHRSLSTFNVLVGGMAFIVVFDTLFGYARRNLILFATARIDTRLSTFVFDRLLNLPMDYFERTATGVITRDVNEVWRIRTFLTGQLFGTLLDTMVLLVVVPAMYWFSPNLATTVSASAPAHGIRDRGVSPFYSPPHGTRFFCGRMSRMPI